MVVHTGLESNAAVMLSVGLTRWAGQPFRTTRWTAVSARTASVSDIDRPTRVWPCRGHQVIAADARGDRERFVREARGNSRGQERLPVLDDL